MAASYGAVKAATSKISSPARIEEAKSNRSKEDELNGLLSGRGGAKDIATATARKKTIFDSMRAGSIRQDNDRKMTVFLVLNYMIGSGILNTPQTFKESGLAATTVLYCIACPALWLGMVILISAAEASLSSLEEGIEEDGTGIANGNGGKANGNGGKAYIHGGKENDNELKANGNEGKASINGGNANGHGFTANGHGGKANGNGGKANGNGFTAKGDGAKANGNGGKALESLEFSALAKRTLGKHGPTIADGSVVVLNFGAVCSYVILVGGLTTSLLSEWAGGAEEAWWESFYVMTPLIVLLLVLPPCLIRHFSNLRWLAKFSLCAITAVVCLVVIGSPFYASKQRLSTASATALDAPLVWWNWTGCIAKLGSVVFAMSCAAAALHAYSAMNPRTETEWREVSRSSVMAGAALCYGTGLIGYLSFRDDTEGDILDNFSGPLASCFKVLVVLHLVWYIPSEIIIMRHSLFALAGHDVMVDNFATVSFVTVGILATIVGVVIGLMLMGVAQGDLFGYVLDLTGGVTASLMSFVLPALTYLHATEGMDEHRSGDGLINNSYGGDDRLSSSNRDIAAYRKASKFLAVFGMVIMVFVPVAVAFSALGY